jgi:hypothetical protein
MDAVARAVRAAVFLAVHVVLALIIIAGLYAVQLGLIAIGDPKLFDIIPVRYIFDAMDVGVLIAFCLFGGMEAYLLFQEHYLGAVDSRGGDDDDAR